MPVSCAWKGVRPVQALTSVQEIGALGDSADGTFEQFYERHFVRMVRLARLVGGEEVPGEELVQDASSKSSDAGPPLEIARPTCGSRWSTA